MLLLVLSISTLIAQSSNQIRFGKNRVQYHRDFDEWSQYESDNFFVYYYGKSRNAAHKVVQMAEYDFDEIQALLEHRMNEKLQIIVYADATDVKQSNIGSEDLYVSSNNQTKVSGTTIFVYFDGNHQHLRESVREGIAAVYLNTMLFGANIQEIVQNAVMLNLPNWFKEGLVAYAGQIWNVERDNELRNILLSRRYKRFERFADDFPRLAGQSMWYFISEKYGRPAVSNLLYLTRINRSIESGFLYVMDQSFQSVTQEWEQFYRTRYENDLKGRQTPQPSQIVTLKKRKFQLPLTQLKLSPDGNKVAYVLNDMGRTTVYLYDLQQKKKQKIFREGYRNALQATDFTYPLIAWNPTGQQLAILYERRDNLKLATYDIYKKKTSTELLSEQYQRVYSLDYVDNFSLLFSAEVSGQSDLFLYATRTRQSQRLTSDIYDDLDATVVNVRNRKGILFSSNRPDIFLRNIKPDSILPVGSFDMFYYDLKGEIKELVRVTNTHLANERYPMAVDSTYFSYLSDRHGIYNRETGFLENFIREYQQHIFMKDGAELVWPMDSTLRSLDSAQIDSVRIRPVIRERAVTHIETNLPYHINQQHSAPVSGKIVESYAALGRLSFYINRLNPTNTSLPSSTGFRSREQQMLDLVFVKDTSQTLGMPLLTNRAPLPILPVDTPKVLTVAALPLVNKDTVNTQSEEELYLFQSEFDYPKPAVLVETRPEETSSETPTLTPPVATRPVETLAPVSGASYPLQLMPNRKLYILNPTRAIPYRLQFRSDFVTSQMDNSLLFEGMEATAANPDGFQPPPPGILLKANVKDLFEDYEFEGGIRIPTTFNGAEYFVTFNNKKHRLDQTYAVYMRNTRFNDQSPTLVPRRREYNILLGQYGVRYPLDVFRSLRATTTLRRDRMVQLATDRATYNVPDQVSQRIGVRLEYVFDNTVDIALNLRTGTRYRVFVEGQKKFSVGDESNFDINFNKGIMTVLAGDFRHYQRFLRHSILAARFTAGTSFGSERILYFLGGMDNWLFPQQNNDIPVPSGNFAFQTLVANMRGFPINIRNGSSFALINTELRVPLFRYISRRIQSPLFKNFQVVGFFDMGTAWEGKTPYRDDNPLNTSRFQDGPFITTTVNYFRDPLVAGYGIGARTTLFGYFIRADYAWGIETQQVQKPRLYLSFGLDF
jgi:hypothetical protein